MMNEDSMETWTKTLHNNQRQLTFHFSSVFLAKIVKANILDWLIGQKVPVGPGWS